MASYSSPHDSQFFTRRVVTFTIAVGVQVLIVALLATGLASRVINIVAPPIQTDIVQEVQKHEEAPPPPPPKMERPPVEVPPPDVAINIPAETRTTAITNTTSKPVKAAPPPPPPPRQVITRTAALGRGFPNSQDFYPPASTRLNEEGTTLMEACFSANGQLTQAPKVLKSSGHSRLDEAAIKLAKAGSGKYVAEAVNGKPVNSCLKFNVVWRLQ